MELLAATTDIYYFTDHYVNYPVVLVRLSRIRPDVPRDLRNCFANVSQAIFPGPRTQVRELKEIVKALFEEETTFL